METKVIKTLNTLPGHEFRIMTGWFKIVTDDRKVEVTYRDGRPVAVRILQ